MTYAPATLLAARGYLRQHTGLPDVSLGIVGDVNHTYGYHLGKDRLSPNDYSARTVRDRAGLSNAASALDVGRFSQLVPLTAYLLAEARSGRLRDVRELIGPKSDGRAYRWDGEDNWREVQRARGDSHEWHLHISFYRDSEYRDKTAPFRAFFEQQVSPPTSTPSINWRERIVKAMDIVNLSRVSSSSSTWVRGSSVRRLQGLLLSDGYGPSGLVATNGRPDGIGGPVTRRLLGDSQRKHRTGRPSSPATPDYIAGQNTWGALTGVR